VKESVFGDSPIFDVDLNSVRDGNMIATLLDHVLPSPSVLVPRVEVGSWVWVRDESLALYPAIVKAVDGRRIRLKIDWASGPRMSFDLTAPAIHGIPVPAAISSRG
jgi:hypothetical protein